MIPAVYVNVGEGALVAHCLANKIGIGSIESLPNGRAKSSAEPQLRPAGFGCSLSQA